MKRNKIVMLALIPALLLVFPKNIVKAADIANAPYNINFQIGRNASEMRFNWFSPYSSTAELQIAKASDVKNGEFPSNSIINGTASEVTATPSVEDNPGNKNQPSVDAASGKNEYANKANVSGLIPSTKYIYRVGDGTTWSSNYSFTTGNPSNGFSFAAFGDPQIGAFDSNKHSSLPHASLADDKSGWANTLKEVTKNPVDFLFSLGDQVNDYSSLSNQQDQYKAFFNPDPVRNFFQSYPLAAFEGNHDHQMGTYYSFHYNQPNLSPLGQTSNSNVNNNDGDYWFTYGNVLFMVLNANDALDAAAHDEFMQQAVAANPNVKWKVAAWHQSAYSEANHSDAESSDDPIMTIRKTWPKLMDKYGVDIVLQGHDHEYTRTFQMYGGVPVDTAKTNAVTDPKGTVYFTLDSGSGSKYYDFKSSSDHTFSSVFWQQYVPSYSYITMNDSKFTINTVRTDTGASIDTYSITKTSSPSPAAGSGSKSVSQPASNSSSASSTPAAQTQSPKTGDSSLNNSVLITLAGLSGLIAFTATGVVIYKKKKTN